MATEYCPRCGSILEKNAKFCTECGAKVAKADAPQNHNAPAAEFIRNPMSSPADSWPKADVFDDAPKAPAIQPDAAYRDSSASSSDEGSWQTNHGGFQQMSSPAPGASGKKGTVLILGIASIIFGISLPLGAYICSIIGLVKASKAAKNGEDVRSGRILCIIGLVLAVFNTVIGILIGVLAALSEFTDVFSTFVSY